MVCVYVCMCICVCVCVCVYVCVCMIEYTHERVHCSYSDASYICTLNSRDSYPASSNFIRCVEHSSGRRGEGKKEEKSARAWLSLSVAQCLHEVRKWKRGGGGERAIERMKR